MPRTPSASETKTKSGATSGRGAVESEHPANAMSTRRDARRSMCIEVRRAFLRSRDADLVGDVCPRGRRELLCIDRAELDARLRPEGRRRKGCVVELRAKIGRASW